MTFFLHFPIIHSQGDFLGPVSHFVAQVNRSGQARWCHPSLRGELRCKRYIWRIDIQYPVKNLA